jgi:pyridoxine kinase
MATVLLISSHVAHGRVGGTLGLFAIERMGVDCMFLPTVLYGVRPDLGPAGGAAVAVGTLAGALDAMDASGALASVSIVLTGYLPTPEHVAFARSAIERVRAAAPGAIVVVDTVLGEDPGGGFLPEPTIEAVRDTLVGLADVLHANRWEAQALSGVAISTLDDAVQAARHLRTGGGGRQVVLTTIDRDGVLTLGADDQASIGRVHHRDGHGARGGGDLLAALLAARLARGEPFEAAVGRALGSLDEVFARSGAILATPQTQAVLFTPLRAVALEPLA